VERAERQIEKATETILNHQPMDVGAARGDPALPTTVIQHYVNGSYLHLFIRP
jgi:hypothetical protein